MRPRGPALLMSVADFAAVQILRALPRTGVSRAVGKLCKMPLPQPFSRVLVRAYSTAYGVDMNECVQPAGHFRTFDEFFTRELAAGARCICSGERRVASPCDGHIQSVGAIGLSGMLVAKGKPYRVADLVGDEGEAVRYRGGQFAVIYLSPRDYHRVHAPVSGAIPFIRSLPGDRYPVNAFGERHISSLYARNRRVAIPIDHEELGRVTVVMVGAIIVGRITVSVLPMEDVPVGTHVLDPAKSVTKGDEIGVFHLGSTAVVLLEPGAASAFSRGPGPVRLGEALTEAA